MRSLRGDGEKSSVRQGRWEVGPEAPTEVRVQKALSVRLRGKMGAAGGF